MSFTALFQRQIAAAMAVAVVLAVLLPGGGPATARASATR